MRLTVHVAQKHGSNNLSEVWHTQLFIRVVVDELAKLAVA